MTDAARERWQVRAPLWMVSATAWIWTGAEAWHGSGHLSSDHQKTGVMLTDWGLMLCAMMVPLLRAPISHICDRSFPHRRVRAIGLFLFGYAALWMTMGALVQLGVGSLLTVHAYILTIAVIVWQCSPIKQFCLNRRHGHPELAAFGWQAEYDAFLFGANHGIWCLGSCWLLMIWPMAFSTWGYIAATVVVTLLMAAEQMESPLPPQWSIRGPRRGVQMVLAQVRHLDAVSVAHHD